MSRVARRSTLVLVTLVTAACSGLLLGCAGGPGRPAARRPGPPKAAAQPLAGKEVFFGGVIAAEVLVGALSGFDPSGDGAADEGGRKPSRRGGGGGNGVGLQLNGPMGLGFGSGGGGGGGGGGPGGGGGREHGGGGEPPPDGGPQGGPGRADFGGGPPVMIHVRFTNTGAEPVDLAVTDFLSPLGNFVVRPERLKLAPGATAELEPMTSRLAGEITSAEVTLTLRRKDATESRTIALQPQPGPARPPAPPADR